MIAHDQHGETATLELGIILRALIVDAGIVFGISHFFQTGAVDFAALARHKGFLEVLEASSIGQTAFMRAMVVLEMFRFSDFMHALERANEAERHCSWARSF